MAIKKASITTFLELSKSLPVFDVRSEGEYTHAHIPGAYSLPLFSDEERKVVGTLYKQQGKQKAIKAGLDFFGPKMKEMINAVEGVLKERKEKNQTIIVHCWRGGMRSAGVAWLLDLYGFEVYTLVGGYKAFRRWALDQFDQEYSFRILGGYTGTAKTEILHSLKSAGQETIDLEGIASHKGSAFGALGQPSQPSQEFFENKLALALSQSSGTCWLEDESQRIGRINIPHNLWNTIRKSPVFFLDLPFDVRLDFIVENYGKFETENLKDAILRITKKLGGLETKNAVALLEEGNIKECFRVLLKYYDKLYEKSLHNREGLDNLLLKFPFDERNFEQIVQKLISIR